MKHIIVCGDLVWDTHIARLQFDPRGYFQPHGQTQLKNRHGGAWYLRDVIQEALSASSIDAAVIAPEETRHEAIEEGGANSGGIAKGFSVWEWFGSQPKSATAKQHEDGKIEFKWKGGRAEAGAWRIEEFMGCQEARWQDIKGELTQCPTIPAAGDKPDLLVIDDLGLGFARHERCWPACLSDPALAPGHILIKATPPFDVPLWDTLLTPECSAKLTVVVSAAALRDHGALLSRGLSWDQSIQEARELFEAGGVVSPLRLCHRVVVIFGRSGAAVFSRVPRSNVDEEQKVGALQFERFVYDPAHLEETWSTDYAGISFGSASIMTAVLASHALMEPPPSSHISVSRGLAAARALHVAGGGRDEKKFLLETSESQIFVLDPKRLPENDFRSAFERSLLDPVELSDPETLPPIKKQTLLTDALGLTSTFLNVAAQDIVCHGGERPLKSVPHLSYGKYFTVDHEEIERLNAVRNLILDYQDNKGDARPLSLAVFGPPGSGKSFAIKQLSEALFGKDHAELEFNLSQFASIEDLHEAFQIVRDKSVQGRMPFVFWDEFDSVRDGTPLGWLKEFLAPMQDAKFVARGVEHPFGKCIFIFAGGTRSTFSEFDRSQASDNDDFKEVKGPDFVSRLRGYVNIKGPNPTQEKGDEVHVIRRALLLRSMLERLHPGIIHPGTKELAISPTVLNAFLGVKRYLHGARSMESIVSLSRLHRCRRFGPSELPAQQTVELHVSEDFMAIVRDSASYHLTTEDIHVLAKKKHESWMAGKKQQGYVHGPERNDHSEPKTHPLMVEYEELTDAQKEANCLPARLTALRLEALGYRICPATPGQCQASVALDDGTLAKLARSEHRRWMHEKLLNGGAYAPVTNDPLFLHADLRKFKDLPDPEKRLDREIIAGITDFLREKKLVLIKKIQTPKHQNRADRPAL